MSTERERAAEALEALDALTSRGQELKARLHYLREVEIWAMATQGVQPGQKVAIADDFEVSRDTGWWAYRECLVPGAIGTVVDMFLHVGRGRWLVAFQPDVAWTRSDYQPEVIHPKNAPVTFHLWADQVRPLREGDTPLVMPTL